MMRAFCETTPNLNKTARPQHSGKRTMSAYRASEDADNRFWQSKTIRN